MMYVFDYFQTLVFVLPPAR